MLTSNHMSGGLGYKAGPHLMKVGKKIDLYPFQHTFISV